MEGIYRKVFHISLLFVFISIANSESIGKISFYVGNVYIKRASSEDWKKAELKAKIFPKDKVKTLKESKCEITFNSDKIARLNENSSITIKSDDSEMLKVQAHKGNIWSNIKKLTSQNNSFEIATPTATAAIRGTRFNVDCNDNKSDYLVFNGSIGVEADSKDGKKKDFVVGSGEKFTMVKDLNEYIKEQREALKNYVESQQDEFERFRRQQMAEFEDYQKEQNQELEKMLEEEKAAFKKVGNINVAKRKFDEEKLTNKDWVKWNKSRDKKLNWEH